MPLSLEEQSSSLRQHEEPFLATFALVGFGAGHLSLDGTWTMVSHRLCEIVGYPRHELLAKALQDIVDPENRRPDLLDPSLLTAGGATVSGEKRIIRLDGQIVWVKIVLAPIRDERTREPRYIFAVVEDITARKRVEQALKRQVVFDELMNAVLTRFTFCAPSEVDASVTFALQQLATFIGVDHAHVITISADRTTWSITHEWCGPKVQRQFQNYRNIPFGSVPWSESRILADQAVRINTLDDYPSEEEVEWQLPERQAGMKSILHVPIHGVGGTIAGAVGVDSHTREMTWSDDEVTRCQLVGDAIASVLLRKRGEEARLEIAGRLISAQEAERTRIARELHDGIGQSIALLGMQMQRAGQPISGSAGKVRPSVAELSGKLKEIGTQLSRLSHQLHSSELEYLGLGVAVGSLCREFSEQYHIPVACRCKDVPTDLESKVALCFVRVIQEALHNVAKHSRAKSVEVELARNEAGLSLTVADDGAGFDTNRSNAGPGLGLISMRERMHLIGGEFMISSSPGNGTRIKAHAPLSS